MPKSFFLLCSMFLYVHVLTFLPSWQNEIEKATILRTIYRRGNYSQPGGVVEQLTVRDRELRQHTEF